MGSVAVMIGGFLPHDPGTSACTAPRSRPAPAVPP
jgi:hypothetical protein